MSIHAKTGRVRGVHAIGAVRADGYTPVTASVTVGAGVGLTRTVMVPEADVQRFVPGVEYAFTLTRGRVDVLAVGAAHVERALSLLASGGEL